MSYKYLVTLKPIGEFFLGSEQTFSKNDLRDKVSFFANSFMFMQQNSIVGMLRKEILKRGYLKLHINGEWVDLPKKKNEDSKEFLEVKELVGNESFSFEKEIDLGIIENISEVFLLKDNKVFYQMPFDEGITPKKSDIEVSFNGKRKKYIKFENLDYKNYSNFWLISKTKKIRYKEVFVESESVGIKKNSDKEGFFQKKSYKLKDDFKFAFILELKKDINLDGLVNIGGDGSNFVLEMQKEFNLIYPTFSKKEGFERIILLSEAYVDEKIEDICDYIFAEHLIYRGVKSGNKKTKRVRVLKRGSVFYTQNIKEVEKLLQNHLYKVGFNRYKRS